MPRMEGGEQAESGGWRNGVRLEDGPAEVGMGVKASRPLVGFSD
jgi:hypothetical protein